MVDRSGWEVIPENKSRFGQDFDRIDAFLKTGNVAWPTGYDRTTRVPPVPRCQAMGETGLHIDPSCQEAHIQNFLDCVRSRKTPTAPMRLAFQAALVVQMANLSLKQGRRVRWNPTTGRVEV